MTYLGKDCKLKYKPGDVVERDDTSVVLVHAIEIKDDGTKIIHLLGEGNMGTQELYDDFKKKKHIVLFNEGD